jgi:hypothetical protein
VRGNRRVSVRHALPAELGMQPHRVCAADRAGGRFRQMGVVHRGPMDALAGVAGRTAAVRGPGHECGAATRGARGRCARRLFFMVLVLQMLACGIAEALRAGAGPSLLTTALWFAASCMSRAGLLCGCCCSCSR